LITIILVWRYIHRVVHCHPCPLWGGGTLQYGRRGVTRTTRNVIISDMELWKCARAMLKLLLPGRIETSGRLTFFTVTPRASPVWRPAVSRRGGEPLGRPVLDSSELSTGECLLIFFQNF
jgi:hypothetical protein